MRKKKLVLPICFIIIVIIVAMIVIPKKIGRKPFIKISGADISSATVQLLPPNETAQMVELYELADGTETVINAYNPFIVIDGVGYRTKYEPCERLSQIANTLLEEQDNR